MIIIFQKVIKRDDLRANREVTYLYGDNCKRRGYGGLAREIRDEPNALGVRTKKHPGRNDSDYFTDDELSSNCRMIRDDLSAITTEVVVVPTAGIGTGLAELQTRAPMTLDYIDRCIAAMMDGCTLPEVP